MEPNFIMNKVSPKVIVVTLNYNQIEYTKHCITSLIKSNYDNFEILVVDNGSTENNYQQLYSFVENSGKVIIKRIQHNLGYVGGINVGMAEAAASGADYFLVMNNDTVIHESAISELVACAEKHNSNAIVSGKVYNYDEKDTLQYIGQEFDEKGMLDQRSIVSNCREKDVGQYDKEMEMGMLDDIFWLLPSSLYSKLGAYSDYFYLYGEQNDYGFRALKEGYKFIYTPLAKIWHKGGVTTCDGDKKAARIEYWTSFAVFKLAALHFPEKADSFNRKWALRQTVKNFILFLTGEKKWENVKAVILAYKNFKHWNLVRYVDNGYNPFS